MHVRQCSCNGIIGHILCITLDMHRHWKTTQFIAHNASSCRQSVCSSIVESRVGSMWDAHWWKKMHRGFWHSMHSNIPQRRILWPSGNCLIRGICWIEVAWDCTRTITLTSSLRLVPLLRCLTLPLPYVVEGVSTTGRVFLEGWWTSVRLMFLTSGTLYGIQYNTVPSFLAPWPQDAIL